ncbi:MAG: mechanosensitive ion channel domain-containing protein [Steroidobacteraceae bacterium]
MTWPIRYLRLVAASMLLLIAFTQSAMAQIPALDRTKASAAAQPVEDPLGRTTPRGVIVAFMRAAERGDFVSAARYLQVNENQRRHTKELAADLNSLVDRYFSQTIMSISDSPAGALDDGLPLDRERVGPLIIGAKRIDISLVRVTDPQSGPIWLISSTTLAQVPALRNSLAQSWIERVMPAPLLNHVLFGISLAHWLMLAATLLIPFIVLVVTTDICIRIGRLYFKNSSREFQVDAWYTAIRWPLIVALTLTIGLALLPLLRLPLTFRFTCARVLLLLAIVSFAWLLRQLLTVGFARARSIVWVKDRTSTQSLMLLGERLLKALVVIVAITIILVIVGVDTKTALAGIGILGVALALGAQRTVENLLGGVFMLSDRAFAIGDLCSVSNRLGWIEDITLRSVRLRTVDQTLVSVPAGVLAQEGIENFATRNKILAQNTLRLRHGTSVEQLKRILGGVRTLLEKHPRIESGSCRIRLVDFGAQAIELELFAYVLTGQNPEFLAVREDLLLQIATIVEAAGSGFAMPTQFIYTQGAADAEAEVQRASARDAGGRKDITTNPST